MIFDQFYVVAIIHSIYLIVRGCFSVLYTILIWTIPLLTSGNDCRRLSLGNSRWCLHEVTDCICSPTSEYVWGRFPIVEMNYSERTKLIRWPPPFSSRLVATPPATLTRLSEEIFLTEKVITCCSKSSEANSAEETALSLQKFFSLILLTLTE